MRLSLVRYKLSALPTSHDHTREKKRNEESFFFLVLPPHSAAGEPGGGHWRRMSHASALDLPAAVDGQVRIYHPGGAWLCLHSGRPAGGRAGRAVFSPAPLGAAVRIPEGSHYLSLSLSP